MALATKMIHRLPYKFTYEINIGGEWKEVGRITYYMWDKDNRRKKSNHNAEWVND